MTPYETHICSNETQNVITLIVCKIRTVLSAVSTQAGLC